MVKAVGVTSLIAAVLLTGCSQSAVPGGGKDEDNNDQNRPTVVKIGRCTGQAGLNGIGFWGPPDKDCNGLGGNWGKYSDDQRDATKFGFCIGDGGAMEVVLWGPAGEACGNMPNSKWGIYEAEVAVPQGIGSCVAKGTALKGHTLWGPMGLTCGGKRLWGKYK